MYMVLFFIVPITALLVQLVIYGLGSPAAKVDTTAVFVIWQWEIASCSGKGRTCVLPVAMLGPISQLCKISAIKTLFLSALLALKTGTFPVSC